MLDKSNKHLNSTRYIEELDSPSKSQYYGYTRNGVKTKSGLLVCGQCYYLGEIRSGLMTGKGKILNVDGYSYIGEFYKGMRDGIGELKTENFSFQGEFEKQKFSGMGKKITKNGEIFLGNFGGDGELEGFGVYQAERSLKLTGEFRNGLLDGFSKIQNKKEIYIGECLDGEMHGFGKLSAQNFKYTGYWKNDKMDIFGNFTDLKNEFEYLGQFSTGKKEGFGLLTDSKKSEIYMGKFSNGDINGFGRLKTSSYEYTGFWKNGTRHGLGLMKQKHQLYFGFWQENSRAGLGILIKGKKISKSEWFNDKMHGRVYHSFLNGSGKNIFCEYVNGFLEKEYQVEASDKKLAEFLKEFNIIDMDSFVEKSEAKMMEFEDEVDQYKSDLRKMNKKIEDEDDLEMREVKLEEEVEEIEKEVEEVKEKVKEIEMGLMKVCRDVKKRNLRRVVNRYRIGSQIVDVRGLDKGVEIELEDDENPEEKSMKGRRKRRQKSKEFVKRTRRVASPRKLRTERVVKKKNKRISNRSKEIKKTRKNERANKKRRDILNASSEKKNRRVRRKRKIERDEIYEEYSSSEEEGDNDFRKHNPHTMKEKVKKSKVNTRKRNKANFRKTNPKGAKKRSTAEKRKPKEEVKIGYKESVKTLSEVVKIQKKSSLKEKSKRTKEAEEMKKEFEENSQISEEELETIFDYDDPGYVIEKPEFENSERVLPLVLECDILMGLLDEYIQGDLEKD